MPDVWGGSWGASWAGSWGQGGVPPLPSRQRRPGGYIDIAALRRSIERTRKAEQKSAEERRKAEERLNRTIESVYRNVVLGEPEAAAVGEAIAAAVIQPADNEAPILLEPGINFAALRFDLGLLQASLDGLAHRARIEAALAAEEDDIEVLLLAAS